MMSNLKTHTDLTSAENKSIGFDFQYYFFLWKLLSLRNGQSVGLEVKDDVHCELNNDEQILYQLKHTIQKSSDGSPKNLTTLDNDLWKTLYNWSKIISDEKDNRSNRNSQLAFIKRTSFVLASNKSATENEFQHIITQVVSDNNITNAREKIIRLLQLTDDIKKQSYISSVLSLHDDVLLQFLCKIHFELNLDDLIKKCKDAIRSDKILEGKIDSVFMAIDSSIREDNFIKVKGGDKITISFDEFYTKYRRLYDVARNDNLIFSSVDDPCLYLNDLNSQTFIMQLIDIGDIDKDDLSSIANYSKQKIQIQNSFEAWLHAGELTTIEASNFQEDAIQKWSNIHKASFRGVTVDTENNLHAFNVLDSIRNCNLTLLGQPFNTMNSNGYFYFLSDHPYIGWRKDWEKYKS
ncbi:hypothetical protein [Aeromonas veronii]|uniref:hypothetical protein n=1 Tax=Aeromonas veronii TaxID=654 RepID=UPI003671CA07